MHADTNAYSKPRRRPMRRALRVPLRGPESAVMEPQLGERLARREAELMDDGRREPAAGVARLSDFPGRNYINLVAEALGVGRS
jgi:hypothetical protein